MVMNRVDLILFNKIKAGNKDALESLFSKYYSPLCNFVNHLIKNPEAAEEMVSDTFYLLWKDRRKLNILTNVKAYLFTIVRNQAFSYLKNNPFQAEELDKASFIEDINHPEAELLYNELKSHYQKAYEALPAQCQLIFKLHKIDGLKYQQVADLLEISIKTVENQMGKALRHIREAIEIYQLEEN